MIEAANPLMAWSFVLALLAYSALVLQLATRGYFRRPVNRTGMTLLLVALVSSLWAGTSLAATGHASLWLWAMVTDIARYAAWFALLVGMFRRGMASPGGHAKPARWMEPSVIVLPLVGLLTLFLPAIDVRTGAGGLAGVFMIMMLLPVLGLVVLEQLFRSLPDDAIWSAKPICLGLAGTFAYDLYFFSETVLLRDVDQDALSIRGLVHAALVPLMVMSTTRKRNWISNLRVSHRVVFHSASLLMVGGYLLFISGVGYYVRFFGGDWGRALQLALVFLALVALIALSFSGSFRARTRVLLGKHFFHYRYDYREEWLKFTQTLSSKAAPLDMGLHVIRGLADMLESPAGTLWLRRGNDLFFRNVAQWNMPQTMESEPADSALLQFMQRTGWVVNLEEYRDAPQRYEHLQIPGWLVSQPESWLLVPLLLGDELLGFVVLANPRTHTDVNWEVTDLLKTAGCQAASFLSQMQATEALLEARKFEAFSRMSAFVVHDLKNIVTQLSLMMKNAKRLGDNPEFQADMLMTVENALERMKQLLLQLREGATAGGAFVGVDLGRIAEVLVASTVRRGRKLELQMESRITARGHPDRLERVVGHLVNNALDATSPDQRVWLKIERLGSHVKVEVGDHGMGMSDAFVQEKLFRPFQTTKDAGMGIGAYESFQYVQELGGKVTVVSREGHGTVVTLLLPLMETFHESDLQRAEVS